MSNLEILVLILATYRVVRLVTTDTISERLRVAVLERSEWGGYLVSCDWCLSIWVTPIAVAIAVSLGDVPLVRYGAMALAISAIIGLISVVEQRIDR